MLFIVYFKKTIKFKAKCYPLYVNYGDFLDLLKIIPFSSDYITSFEKQYAAFVYKNFLDVPPVIKKYLTQLIKKSGVDLNNPDFVKQLRDFIATTYTYDYMYKRCPSNTDPVLYFLDEEKKGVCWQFASSFALMLRTIGVPARVVGGICTYLEEGIINNVYKEEYHAWVEYYLNGTGWLIIDPTPISNNNHGSTKDSFDSFNQENNNNFEPLDENEKWKNNDNESENNFLMEEINQKILQTSENLKERKSCGNIPAGIEIKIKELKNPTLDWRVLLYDFIDK